MSHSLYKASSGPRYLANTTFRRSFRLTVSSSASTVNGRGSTRNLFTCSQLDTSLRAASMRRRRSRAVRKRATRVINPPAGLTKQLNCRSRLQQRDAARIQDGGPGQVEGPDTHEGSRVRRWRWLPAASRAHLLTEAFTMRSFQPPPDTRFYAGVDLHARALFLVVLDHDGQTRFARNLPAQPEPFLRAVEPFRAGLLVACACVPPGYWLADTCRDHAIAFVLGHAGAMRAV